MVPIRTLNEKEVLLSGLEGHRRNTDRCFHPALISSALGDDQTFRRWINGVTDVADKNAVLRVYTNLCKGVEEL